MQINRAMHTTSNIMENENQNESYPRNEWLFSKEQRNATPSPAQDDVKGFGTDPGERAYFASVARHDDPDDEDAEESEEELTDWGATDPLDQPGNLPDPMDPSGPGSAV